MKANKIILGTVQFGLPYGINNNSGQISKEEVFKILDFAQVNKVKYLDTAAAYGNAEEVLGSYFLNNKNHKFDVITKFSFKENRTCEASMLNSLSKLKIDSIETIMFHSFADYQLYKSQLGVFCEKYKDVKFKKIGVSVYTNQEAEALIKDKNVKTVQMPYNFLDNSSKRDVIFEKLKTAGKTIHTRSVFLQGLFLKPIENYPESLFELKAPINMVKNVANQTNISISAIALAYATSNNFIDNILIGVDNLQQLQENLSFTSIKLSKNTIETLNQIDIKNTDLLNPSKWKI